MQQEGKGFRKKKVILTEGLCLVRSSFTVQQEGKGFRERKKGFKRRMDFYYQGELSLGVLVDCGLAQHSSFVI